MAIVYYSLERRDSYGDITLLLNTAFVHCWISQNGILQIMLYV